jgi:hypothetical protein
MLKQDPRKRINVFAIPVRKNEAHSWLKSLLAEILKRAHPNYGKALWACHEKTDTEIRSFIS